jgi:ribosomal protein S18 acetylase RimI-like enzyme
MARIGAATFALGDSPSTTAADLDRYLRTELTPDRFAGHMRDAAVAAYIAEVAGAAAGYLMLRTDGNPQSIAPARRPLRLWRIYVLPAHHGSGVASALMQQALDYAREHDHDVLWLGVSEHNARGQAFYRKHGFRVVGDEQFHVGASDHHDVIMARITEHA